MSTRSSSTPGYRRQKSPKGDRAFVELNGKRIYLGLYDSAQSRAEYHRLIAEWIANDKRPRVEASDLTIVELVAAFMRFVKAGDADKREVQHFRAALEPLTVLYGETPAIQFGPLALKAVRERLIVCGKRTRTRQYVNRLVKQIRFMFKWAVGEEMVPVGVHEALRAVPGLQRGKCEAGESEPVKPVPQEHIDAIRPYLSRQVETLIDLQLLTAARPGELLIMRSIDLDTTGNVWTYMPKDHKSAWRGHHRTIYLGPKAQDLIRPFLANRPVEAFLFSPVEAVAEQRERRHAERVTPLSCGNKPGSNVKARPEKTPGERYTPDSYRQAIQYACERAGIDKWFPYQLRHNAATHLRKEFGLDVAATMLGHVRCDVTQVYAEKNHELAMQIAGKVG